ncbi:MAG: signal peptidase I [Bacteroidetes bacterium]|nr:signal peptidase I [Bacteroidota bacterium]
MTVVFRSFGIVALVLSLGACRGAKFESGSMEPTIHQGDVVTINHTAYLNSDPQRWDVAAYEDEDTHGNSWCHRIVGMPGETIDLRDGFVIIDSVKLEYPAKIGKVRYSALPAGTPTKIHLPYLIPKDCYFVLGDNTSDAIDSRYLGAIKRSDIRGRIEGK